jgi:hypothetical protein
MNKYKISPSFFILIICYSLLSYSSLVFYPRWQKEHTESTIAYDVEGYYWYLPSLFIFQDLKHQAFKDSILQKYQASATDNFQHGFVHQQSGNYVLKYTSGMAIMYFPAFVVGHSVALIAGGYDADGFSIPYKLSLQLWGLLFSFIGLYYLRKLLLLYYSDTVVAIVLFLLVLGTNYLNYSAIDVGMSHSWLFTLYVFILLNTHYFYKTFSRKYAIRLGLLIGMVTLIRPTEIIAILIPILWGLESVKDFKQRLSLFYEKKALLSIVLVCIFSVLSIQLFYWHYASDNWIVYSYQGQSFNFKRPHAFVYSWSYKAGWLRYTPMMIFCFVGYFFYPKYGKNRWAVMTFFTLNYYIVSAWDIWDYGGFSGRAMIQSYPVLLFTLATLVELVLNKKLIKWILMLLVLLFVYLNIWWTYQAHTEDGLVDALCTTKEYYWKMVGRWSLPEKYQKLKDTDELPEQEPSEPRLLYTDTTRAQYCVDKEVQNKHVLSLPYHKAGDDNSWVRVTAHFKSKQKEWNVWKMPQFIVAFKSGDKAFKTRMIRVHRFLGDYDARELFLDLKIPKEQCDTLSVDFWNGEGDKETCFEGLSISEFSL